MTDETEKKQKTFGYSAEEKQRKVRRETTRLRRIFRPLDPNVFKTIEGLIKSAAFMAITLEELEITINEEGITEEYQNGQYQKGTKQSEAVKVHLSMMKNYSTTIRMLADLAPVGQKKSTRLDALRGL